MCRAAAVSCVVRHRRDELQDRLHVIGLRVRRLVCVLPAELRGPAQTTKTFCKLDGAGVHDEKGHENKSIAKLLWHIPAESASSIERAAVDSRTEWIGNNHATNLTDCLTAHRSRAVAQATSAASWHSRLTCVCEVTILRSGSSKTSSAEHFLTLPHTGAARSAETPQAGCEGRLRMQAGTPQRA